MNKSRRYQPVRYKHLSANSSPPISGRALPVLYEERGTCCGCSACFAVCSVNAISMEPDEEGFLYPVVDASACIRCHQCLGVCAFKRDQKKKGF